MNSRPIESAADPDLRLSGQALARAARRAHEVAAQTGTAVVVMRNGILQKVLPDPRREAAGVAESVPNYLRK